MKCMEFLYFPINLISARSRFQGASNGVSPASNGQGVTIYYYSSSPSSSLENFSSSSEDEERGAAALAAASRAFLIRFVQCATRLNTTRSEEHTSELQSQFHLVF